MPFTCALSIVILGVSREEDEGDRVVCWRVRSPLRWFISSVIKFQNEKPKHVVDRYVSYSYLVEFFLLLFYYRACLVYCIGSRAIMIIENQMDKYFFFVHPRFNSFIRFIYVCLVDAGSSVFKCSHCPSHCQIKKSE